MPDLRRLVFCISSGRAGSEYLASVLGTASNARSFHEPEPTMTGQTLLDVMSGDPDATLEARVASKGRALEAALAEEPNLVHVETSHMFIKTFHDVVDQVFSDDDVRVVVLRRDLAATLSSFVRMGYFTDRAPAWPAWMHDAWAPGAIEAPPLPHADADAVDRSIAYLLDIDARAERYVAEHPDRCHEITLEELQDLDAVRALFGALDLDPTPQTDAAVGTRVNARDARKRTLGITFDVEQANARLASYRRRYEEAGRPAPAALLRAVPDVAAPVTIASRRAAPRRIAHLVNPVASGPTSDLTVAQPITFEAMRRARAVASHDGIDVELLATGLPQDRSAAPDDFRWTGDLPRSALDLRSFEVARPLPLLGDILAGLASAPEADLYVYTNVDIAPMPGFYSAIARLHEAGHDAFVINRRTISTRWTSPDDIALMEAQPGEIHAGHDCFVFARHLLEKIDVGRVVVGINWVGRALLWNLALHGEGFRELTDVHLTYHLGDDRVWLDSKLDDWRAFNAAEAYSVLERLLTSQPALAPDAAIRPYLADVGLLG